MTHVVSRAMSSLGLPLDPHCPPFPVADGDCPPFAFSPRSGGGFQLGYTPLSSCPLDVLGELGGSSFECCLAPLHVAVAN